MFECNGWRLLQIIHCSKCLYGNGILSRFLWNLIPDSQSVSVLVQSQCSEHPASWYVFFNYSVSLTSEPNSNHNCRSRLTTAVKCSDESPDYGHLDSNISVTLILTALASSPLTTSAKAALTQLQTTLTGLQSTLTSIVSNGLTSLHTTLTSGLIIVATGVHTALTG